MKRIVWAAAAAAALFFFNAVPGHAAYGDAPWCAVIAVGTGEVYWDCQYETFAACVPNVLAGNRGFCNVNPTYRPVAATPAPHAMHRRAHKHS
jgi:Protein of unknown function (DUF3551)